MTGTGNPHKQAAQIEKAGRLCDAAERIFEVAVDDAVSLEALADVLSTCPDEQFRPLFVAAKVRAHSKTQWCSDDVRNLVVDRLRQRASFAAMSTDELFADF